MTGEFDLGHSLTFRVRDLFFEAVQYQMFDHHWYLQFFVLEMFVEVSDCIVKYLVLMHSLVDALLRFLYTTTLCEPCKSNTVSMLSRIIFGRLVGLPNKRLHRFAEFILKLN